MTHPRTAPFVAQVEETFGEGSVSQTEMPDGSTWLNVAGVDLGPGWNPRTTTLSVKLAPTFPDSAPYPWYLPTGTAKSDGSPVDRLSGPIDLDGSSRLQLSLNAPWSPEFSLADRMLGVVRWLRRVGAGTKVAS